ncbi:MAG: aminoacyl-tRNA hydrolase [Candidatus Omnitrophica bacterium]|nr:aminoacyl-tRNA hydrolase [Candidatus Omnitrophota bacterium]
MKIIVGLGNPGVKYKNNRHNVGFMVMDEIAKRQNCAFKRGFLLNGYVAKTKAEKENVILLKPSTFMNHSGLCVKKIISKYRLRPYDLLVVYDDADLPLGNIRIKRSGSSGGHQGMASIIDNLGINDIARLKIGIGKPEKQDLADYVLSDFSHEEKKEIFRAIQTAASICIDWLSSGIDYVMTNYNKQQEEKSEKKF